MCASAISTEKPLRPKLESRLRVDRDRGHLGLEHASDQAGCGGRRFATSKERVPAGVDVSAVFY